MLRLSCLSSVRTTNFAHTLQFADEIVFSSHIPADVFLAEKRKEKAKQELYELESGVKERFSIKRVKIG